MKPYLKIFILPAFLVSCAAAPIKTVHTSSTNKAPKKASNKSTTKKSAKGMAGQAPVISSSSKADVINPLQAEINNAKALEATDQIVKAALIYADVATKAVSPKDQDALNRKTVELLERMSSKSEFEDFIDDTKNLAAKSEASFRLGKLLMTERKNSDAIEYFENCIQLAPGSNVAIQAENHIATLKALTSVSPTTIGVVLPLTGKNAAQGARALKGITMGLGLHQVASNFKLAVIDSEGQPEAAKNAVERLVKEDNVIAVVGDIVSKSSESVAISATELGVPVIALSQRPGITDIGSTIFRNALTPEQQVKQLVRSAMNDLGMKRFAILFPNDSYGVEYTNLFWDEVVARGGTITAVQPYNSNDKDYRIPVEKLLGVYYGEARQAEYYLSLKEIKSQDKKRSIRQSNNEVVLKPITDFDAIFIPDGSKNFGQLAAMISYYDVTQAKFLGTNLWNTNGINKRTGIFGDNIVFVDTFLPINKEASAKFASEFKSVYGEDPSLIEIQAYDSALMLRQVISGGADTRDSLVQKLAEIKEFPGAAGPVKMTENRELIRPITTLTLIKGEISPLKISK